MFFQLDGKLLQEQYIGRLSGFLDWDQGNHASDWVLFEDNLGPFLSIDETCLSQGELYTVITNKEAKGKKGALVALVKGVQSDKVIDVLSKMSLKLRNTVKEVTLDLAATMERIAIRAFPKAKLVSDRFHVQQLASDAVQQLRIEYRWEAIDQENKEIELSKELKRPYLPEILANGDSLKQLLVRSRFLLFKDESKWTPSQYHRAEILFERYPALEKAYRLSRDLSKIFTTTKEKEVGFTRLARWYEKVEKAELKSFRTVRKTIENHYSTILNYFDNRSTNASAESFNRVVGPHKDKSLKKSI